MANPATTLSNATEDRILVYYVTAEGNLALRSPPIAEKDKELNYRRNGTPKGNFALKNCIAGVHLHGIPTVFGMMQKGDLADKKLILSQMSPIIQIVAESDYHEEITTDDAYPSLAAVSDNKHTAWLYFLQKSASDGKLNICETRLYYEDYQTTKIGVKFEPASYSRLAAVYIPKIETKMIFFQPPTSSSNTSWNPLVFTTTLNPEDASEIPGTKNAAKGTPLAATRGPDGVTYLYWMSQQNGIERATRTADGVWSFTTTSMKAGEQTVLSNSSQISVTQMGKDADKGNHVFFIESGSSRYVDHKDTGLL